jgi:hypothetical protein
MGGDATQDVTIEDPPAVMPAPPPKVGAFPGPGGALLFWDSPYQEVDGGRIETATGYRIRWGPNADASGGGSDDVVARDDAHYVVTGLADGAEYYFKVSSLLDDAESAGTIVGPYTIGASTGLRTVSGTISRPPTVTGGALYVLVSDGETMFKWYRKASPAEHQSYSVAGVPDGTWWLYAFLDLNSNGTIDRGDLFYEGMISVAGNTSASGTLLQTPHRAAVVTDHFKHADLPWDAYNLEFRVEGEYKQPVAVSIVSGPNVRLPADLPKDWDEFRLLEQIGAAVPAVDDTYELRITYSDGTIASETVSVTGVLGGGAFASNLQAVTVGAGSPEAPQFTWTEPSSLSDYTYRVGLWGGASWWWPDDDVGAPAGTTSVVYNENGVAEPATLGPGTYTWYVKVTDPDGNSTSMQKDYIRAP